MWINGVDFGTVTYVGSAATAHETFGGDCFRFRCDFAVGAGSWDGSQCNARHQQGGEKSEELHLGSSSDCFKGFLKVDGMKWR